MVYSEISEGGGAIGHWTLASVAFTEKFFKNDAKFHRERDHPLNCPCCYRLVCRKIGTVWFIFDWVSWFVWSTANSSLLHSRSFCGHATLFTGDERCVTTQRWATWPGGLKVTPAVSYSNFKASAICQINVCVMVYRIRFKPVFLKQA